MNNSDTVQAKEGSKLETSIKHYITFHKDN